MDGFDIALYIAPPPLTSLSEWNCHYAGDVNEIDLHIIYYKYCTKVKTLHTYSNLNFCIPFTFFAKPFITRHKNTILWLIRYCECNFHFLHF